MPVLVISKFEQVIVIRLLISEGSDFKVFNLSDIWPGSLNDPHL